MRRSLVRLVTAVVAWVALSGCGTAPAAATPHSFNSTSDRHRAIVFAKAQALRRGRARFPAATVSVEQYIVGWVATRLRSAVYVNARDHRGKHLLRRLWYVFVAIRPKTGTLTLTGIDEHPPETKSTQPGVAAPGVSPILSPNPPRRLYRND
jgi:hypothetical protein